MPVQCQIILIMRQVWTAHCRCQALVQDCLLRWCLAHYTAGSVWIDGRMQSGDVIIGASSSYMLRARLRKWGNIHLIERARNTRVMGLALDLREADVSGQFNVTSECGTVKSEPNLSWRITSFNLFHIDFVRCWQYNMTRKSSLKICIRQLSQRMSKSSQLPGLRGSISQSIDRLLHFRTCLVWCTHWMVRAVTILYLIKLVPLLLWRHNPSR